MAIGLEVPAAPTRFSWILQGLTHGPDRIFDEDLAHYPDAAILPTRGAMLAEWLLIVPRIPSLSVAALEAPARRQVLRIAEDAAANISAHVGSSILFEHGPGLKGSPVGCGVDQAHIHAVGGASISVDALMQQVSEVNWKLVDHDDPWATVAEGSNYLLLRDEARAVLAIVNHPVSQRLRRAVAAIINRPHEWDYRIHPHANNALRTKKIFRSERACAA